MERRLYEASMSGNVEALEALIREDELILDKASVTCFDATPLHVAALRGHVSFARAILSRKPKLATELDSLWRTPLHLASAEGHVEIVRELLRVNNDDICWERDQDGRTPLHLAVMKGRVEVIRELIRVRPDSIYEKLDGGGETVLHLCVKYNRIKALKTLVEDKVVTNNSNMEEFLLSSQDNDGNNILHVAVGLKQMNTIKYLFEKTSIKQQANIKNNKGCTALDVVKYCPDLQSKKIRDFLLQSTGPHSKYYYYSTRTTTSIARGWNKYFKADEDWLKEVRGHLITAATLTATMSYQAILSPPGSVWQENKNLDNISPQADYSDAHQAGTSILGGIDWYRLDFYVYILGFPTTYGTFISFNTVSLILSVCTILLALSGIPRRNKFFLWLLVLAMSSTVFTMAVAYMSLIPGLFPMMYDKRDLQIMFDNMIIVLLIICGLALVLHICRFCVWLSHKYCSIKRWLRRRKRSSN